MRRIENIRRELSQAQWLIWALVLLLPAGLLAQPNSGAKFTNGSKSVVIPLDLDNNIIRMKVQINGSRELNMIFDTGGSVTGIDERFIKELELKTSGDTLKGSGTGGNFTGTYVKTSTISVAGAEVYNQPLAAFKINAPPGFDFDGIIGYDFIKAFVVEIDYEKKTMTLSDPKTYFNRGKGEIVPLELKGRQTPLIHVVMGLRGKKPFSVKLELDTGADLSFRINNPIVVSQNLLRYFKNGVKSTGRGAGGEDKRMWVNFDSATFSGIRIKNPPVALSFNTEGADADPASNGVIGGEFTFVRRGGSGLKPGRRRLR